MTQNAAKYSGEELISLLVPIYNEADIITKFLSEAEKFRNDIREIIMIDDGSTDNTLSVLKQAIERTDMNIKVVSLLNNMNKDKAIIEGLQYAEGELIAIMDVDMQFPFFEMIRMKQMLLQNGSDLIIGLKSNYNSIWNLMFRLFSTLSFTKIFSNNLSDFIVGKSEIVKTGLMCYQGSYNFSLKGVLCDLSPNTEFVKIVINQRSQGSSKMRFGKLLDVFTSTFLLAFPNIVRISFIWSFLFGSFAVIYSTRIIYTKLFYGAPAGFPSLMITQLIGFTFVFLFIGILGEYINALMKQTIIKKPFVHVKEYVYNKTKISTSSGVGKSYTVSLAQVAGNRQGVCIWLTGLPCSGKTTIADMLSTALRERGVQVSLLDGDVIRTHLSNDLGFGLDDRLRNARRVGFVASEIVKHDGVVVCALISPYRVSREEIRAMIGKENFIEVFVDAPVEVCEHRDIKGHYAQARRGELRQFTGIDSPYEPPTAPDVHLKTDQMKPDEAVQMIINLLEEKRFIPNG